ncbi:MAG: hypothetical protein FWG32_06800, partial [Oscillospiraceae bacterium]|nr:hypothetical protein [Oscillospiraceae bacterium]
MASKSVIKVIDRAIKEVWKKSISRDYRTFSLLMEDTLKCSLYYHLRKKLGERFLSDNNIRIFSEFTRGDLTGTGCKADIAIVELKKSFSEQHLGANIKSTIAIIELKYDHNDNAFVKDIRKIKSYITDLKVDCLYYLGFIAEKEYEIPNWLDGRQTNNWANKKVVVLSANREVDGDGTLRF